MTLSTVVTETEVMARNVAPLQSILFVEDESHDFIIARYHLEQMNVRNPIIHVPTAAELFAFLDGDEGYSDRRKYPLPAVIILDVRLPDRSGIEAQAMIRSSLKHRKIPIISISGNKRISLLQQSVELGANAWMAKPFEPADFLAIVVRLNLPVWFNNLDTRRRN
jgi:CheY-like chemotaxis protein